MTNVLLRGGRREAGHRAAGAAGVQVGLVRCASIMVELACALEQRSDSTDSALGRGIMPVRERFGQGRIAFVLIHASPGDATQWKAVTEGLRGRGEVVVLDLPDYGNAPDALSLDPDDSLADVRTAVASCAPQPVVLGGMSYGAYLAARLLEQAPDHVAGALLLSGFAGLTEQQGASYRELANGVESGAVSWREFTDLALGVFLGPSRTEPELRRDLEGWLLSLSRARVVRALRRSAACALPERRVRRLLRPATLLQGRTDVALPIAFAEELAHLGQTRLEVIDTSSHLLALTHPGRCVELLLQCAAGLH